MKKLYLATKTITAMFLSDEEHKVKDAKKFLAEEEKNVWVDRNTQIQQINTEQEIPKEWQNDNLIWGSEDEISAAGWLYELGEEYQTYLRLKAKYD